MHRVNGWRRKHQRTAPRLRSRDHWSSPRVLFMDYISARNIPYFTASKAMEGGSKQDHRARKEEGTKGRGKGGRGKITGEIRVILTRLHHHLRRRPPDVLGEACIST